jgi:hypothetical protein
MKRILVLLATASCLALASCSAPSGGGAAGGGGDRAPGIDAYSSYDLPASRPRDPSRVRVKVSLANQAAYVLEGERSLLVMPVAVGTSSNPTPQGNFRIFKKELKHRAHSHGYAYNGNSAFQAYRARKPAGWKFKGTPMPHWCEFKANYGFHTGWLKSTPCTLGCLRMHENVAPKFFQLVKVGTPVNIQTKQPEDETIGRNIPRPPDAGLLPDYPPSFYLGEGYFTKHKAPVFQ